MKTKAHAATHDALTGLPNEYLFHDRLTQVIVTSERGTGRFALLMVAINNYAAIYDEHGQAFSDRLILRVAECLQDTLRVPDTITRRENNTFVILLPLIESQSILNQLVSRIEKELTEPLQIDTNKIHLSISIGQANYPYNGADASALLQYVESDIKKAADDLA